MGDDVRMAAPPNFNPPPVAVVVDPNAVTYQTKDAIVIDTNPNGPPIPSRELKKVSFDKTDNYMNESFEIVP